MSTKVQPVMAPAGPVYTGRSGRLMRAAVCPWCKTTAFGLDAAARILHCSCKGVFLIDPKVGVRRER